MLGIGGGEGLQRRDRLVILARLPQLEALACRRPRPDRSLRRSPASARPSAAAVFGGFAASAWAVAAWLRLSAGRRPAASASATAGAAAAALDALLERRDALVLVGRAAAPSRLRSSRSRLPFSSDWRTMSAICRSSASSRWSRVTDRRLGRRGIVGEASGVGRPALREDLPLDLLDLLFEPLDPLLGVAAAGAGQRRRLEARAMRCSHNGCAVEILTKSHASCGSMCARAACAAMNLFRLVSPAPAVGRCWRLRRRGGWSCARARRCRTRAGAAAAAALAPRALQQVGGQQADVASPCRGRPDWRRDRRCRP